VITEAAIRAGHPQVGAAGSEADRVAEAVCASGQAAQHPAAASAQFGQSDAEMNGGLHRRRGAGPEHPDVAAVDEHLVWVADAAAGSRRQAEDPGLAANRADRGNQG
jgi:hypothetical protein